MLLSERVFVLKNVSIFAQTDEQVLLKIAAALSEMNVASGQTIVHKGEDGKSMYIILSGSVKVHDEEFTFATLQRKQVFGEYSMLDTEVRSASVTAIEPTKLLKLDQHAFYGIMMNHIDILRGILQVLVERARLSIKLSKALEEEKKTIEAQSKEIKKRSEEIFALNIETTKQQRLISEANELLKEKVTLITSSINYAQNIQGALLPDLDDFKKLIPHSFIYYRPKDIVSGDFYWISDVSPKKDIQSETSKIMLACVDCTGHGVPGAFMSFLGITYLNQIVDYQGVTDVSQVLTELNENIRKALKQELKHNQDGMDLSLCLIDKEKKTLEFSSARSFLFYINGLPDEQNDIKLIKGDNIPIGGYSSERRFTKHIIPFDENTVFYLFTDGYRDQFGQENNRKFMMRGFKELIYRIHQKSLDEQLTIIRETHEEWRGELSQTDDILVMGFKIMN